MTRLLTAEQLCQEYGIPTPRTVRTMRPGYGRLPVGTTAFALAGRASFAPRRFALQSAIAGSAL